MTKDRRASLASQVVLTSKSLKLTEFPSVAKNAGIRFSILEEDFQRRDIQIHMTIEKKFMPKK